VWPFDDPLSNQLAFALALQFIARVGVHDRDQEDGVEDDEVAAGFHGRETPGTRALFPGTGPTIATASLRSPSMKAASAASSSPSLRSRRALKSITSLMLRPISFARGSSRGRCVIEEAWRFSASLAIPEHHDDDGNEDANGDGGPNRRHERSTGGAAVRFLSPRIPATD